MLGKCLRSWILLGFSLAFLVCDIIYLASKLADNDIKSDLIVSFFVLGLVSIFIILMISSTAIIKGLYERGVPIQVGSLKKGVFYISISRNQTRETDLSEVNLSENLKGYKNTIVKDLDVSVGEEFFINDDGEAVLRV